MSFDLGSQKLVRGVESGPVGVLAIMPEGIWRPTSTVAVDSYTGSAAERGNYSDRYERQNLPGLAAKDPRATGGGAKLIGDVLEILATRRS